MEYITFNICINNLNCIFVSNLYFEDFWLPSSFSEKNGIIFFYIPHRKKIFQEFWSDLTNIFTRTHLFQYLKKKYFLGYHEFLSVLNMKHIWSLITLQKRFKINLILIDNDNELVMVFETFFHWLFCFNPSSTNKSIFSTRA